MTDMEQKESQSSSSDTSKPMSILCLNTTKAGMEGLDKEKINAIVAEASKGSKFYDAKSKNQEKIDSQVEELSIKLKTFSEETIARAQRQADVFLATHSETRDLTRVIVHVDMDAFYAAVEEKDDPLLKTKPMAVGSLGMLSTSNYLARKFGVRAAMPGFIAKKLCPQLVIVPPNFQKYRAASLVVREVFREYDPNFCSVSLDEAYLDITEYLEVQKSFGNLDITPWAAVNELRAKIFERTGLTASAGIAPNTFLAKVCSDQNKPNGQYELMPDADVILSFVKNLPIRKVNGIGNVTEQLLKKVLNIDLCQDLFDQRAFLVLLFSEISSSFFLRTCIGIGNTQVGDMANRERKSMSTESTFRETSDKNELIEIIKALCAELSNDLMSEELKGSQLTVKIKTAKFSIKTRVANLIQPSNEVNVLQQAARRLLHSFIESSEEKPLTLRLLGVRMSGFKDRHDDIGGETKRIKQQSTLDTFFAGQSRKAGDIQPSQSYQCPICGEDVIAANEEIFNKHLDNCLNTSEKCADQTKSTDENSFPKNKPQPQLPKPLVQDQPGAHWTCPVCESQINCDQMNVHLDECLNKPVISEIRLEQTQERKRQADCDETKLKIKKAKTRNSNSNSILTYFSSR